HLGQRDLAPFRFAHGSARTPSGAGAGRARRVLRTLGRKSLAFFGTANAALSGQGAQRRRVAAEPAGGGATARLLSAPGGPRISATVDVRTRAKSKASRVGTGLVRRRAATAMAELAALLPVCGRARREIADKKGAH